MYRITDDRIGVHAKPVSGVYARDVGARGFCQELRVGRQVRERVVVVVLWRASHGNHHFGAVLAAVRHESMVSGGPRSSPTIS